MTYCHFNVNLLKIENKKNDLAYTQYRIIYRYVELEDQREIYPYSGSKSKSEVWKYFGFYRKQPVHRR